MRLSLSRLQNCVNVNEQLVGGWLMQSESDETFQSKKSVSMPLVIVAASVGSAFEWYDFFLYGTVASILSKSFFSTVSSNLSYLFALLTFAAGFAVRPLGALFFGRLGDLWGRKNTFLLTMLVMGFSTFAVGCLPDASQIGIAAPILLVIARLSQGFAVGGEYGGAVTYIAEHAPEGRRGLYTSFIQVTCSFGLFLALSVVLATRVWLGEAAFASGGWRLPFLFSAVLLVISLFIRIRLSESPVFSALQRISALSKSPVRDSFKDRKNIRRLFLATFGLTAGMTVVFYTSQVYSQFFMEKVLHVDGVTSNSLLAFALLLGTPFFILFGWMSDKIGRKRIIMTGCLLAAFTYFPLFYIIADSTNPALMEATERSPVTVTAPSDECSWQFDLVKRASRSSACDVARSTLADAGVSYRFEPSVSDDTQVRIGGYSIEFDKAGHLEEMVDRFQERIKEVLKLSGYPAEAIPGAMNEGSILLCLFIMIIYVTMCYGPLAAILVEMFPPQIRYTSLSISYNVAVGWLGGFVPAVAFTIVILKGDIFAGLWYPVIIAIMGTIIICFIKDKRSLLSQ
jgi:MFS family permease